MSALVNSALAFVRPRVGFLSPKCTHQCENELHPKMNFFLGKIYIIVQFRVGLINRSITFSGEIILNFVTD